jgi:hypothetical protein
MKTYISKHLVKGSELMVWSENLGLDPDIVKVSFDET